MTATEAPARPVGLPRDEDPRNPVHRLRALLDEGTLELITPEDDSGMLAAVGTVDGTRVVAFCSDATVMGGAMGDVGCRVVVDAYHRAMTDSTPIIGLWHSGGARLAEGVLSLHAVGRIFQAMTQASGRIPQISVVLGPAAGGAGALEAIATILAIYHRVAPPTINLDDQDPQVELDIATKPRDLPAGDIAALNNSFGFGGANVAVAFGSTP